MIAYDDPGAGSKGTATDVIDPYFRQEVILAMVRKGINMSKVPLADLERIVQMAWSDPYVQSYFQDPNNANAYGLVNMVPVIDQALFSVSQSPNELLLQTGIKLLETAGTGKLTSEQQQYLVSGAGTDNDIRQIIIQVANEKGVDPALALAIASQESGLNPRAAGDGGHSIGLFQLNDQGEGAGMTVAEREDPRRNAEIALTMVAQVAKEHPDWSPGQIAAAAQRPADQAGYATSIDALYGQISAGHLPTRSKTGGNALLDALYPEVVSLYKQYMGRRPTAGEISRFVGMDAQQMKDAMRALASHIPGMTIGQASDLRQLADSISQGALGHDATDQIVKELFDQGYTRSAQVSYWYGIHSPIWLKAEGGKAMYNAAYAAAQGHLRGIWNENGFDPRIADSMVQASGQAPPTPTEQVATADNAPLPKPGDYELPTLPRPGVYDLPEAAPKPGRRSPQ